MNRMAERTSEIVELCRRLIQERSYSGEENAVAALLADTMKQLGYDSVEQDAYGNVIGCIRGNRPGRKILFDGHMDTVPVGEEKDWHYPPFAGTLEKGRIYGRGASDMKGAIAAFTLAAAYFAADCDKDFPGEIYVAGVVHEECFEGVAARAISGRVQPDYVVIGEASNCNLKIGQRGRAELKLETFGVPAHSANPEKGVNAVYAMAKVIAALQTLPAPEHPVLGKGIMELTDIKSLPYPGASVVPEYCSATYDRRLLVGETPESVLAPVQEIIRSLMQEDASVQAKASFAVGEEKCYTGETIQGERFFPGWLFPETADYLEKIKAAFTKEKLEFTVTKYNFCTNASHYAGEAGICTLGMGPSDESLAHVIDEYVEVEQLAEVSRRYYLIMEALLTD